jgi:dipeptidyl-peptidase-4
MKKHYLFAVIGLFLINLNLFSQESKKISLEDIWLKGTFRPAFIQEIRSMKDGEHYCVLEDNKIKKYSYKDGKEKSIILDISKINLPDNIKKIEINEYNFSSDESKILISSNTESIYRHSSISDYYVYDLKSNTIELLTNKGKIRLAEFSPDGNNVVFIKDNNLIIKNLINKIENNITTDGKQNHIINGSTDWVYEEEFGITKGFFWSPDGKKVAYYRFDESNVKEYNMQMWGNLYPEDYRYKYPKAGEDNSIVDIYVFDITTGKSVKMDLGKETNQYIPRIKWTNENNTLAVYRLNRLQNFLEMLYCNANDGSSKVIYSEKNKYYIEINDNLNFLPNGNFVLTSEIDGFNHIYLYDKTGKLIKQLTSGKWDVDEIKGIDTKQNIIYYTAARTAAYNKDLCSVNIDGSRNYIISTGKGNNKAEFSSNFKYYISTFSDANTPNIYTINTSNGKEIKVLENNQKLANTIKQYNFQPKEFGKFTTEQGIELNYWMIKPANFDISRKYPVLMYVYGGPGHNTVTNSYTFSDLSWFQMLAQQGYIVISVDNRGTGNRGEEFKKCTYMELGKLETEDQIAAAKYFGNQSYIDKNRIGIFGWSYGGYMSTLCMTKGADYFKAGIAVAPVTNWRYYDNIYTERFMRTPQENPSGYDDNSPINHVKKLKGKYLLIHGTGDDNVHVQNSMDLITALVNANKQFDMFLYPNKNHSIFGGYTRYHLYKKMTDFILNNL